MSTIMPVPATGDAEITAAVLLEQDCGLMVEGPYGWHEYCEEHGQAILHLYPDRKSRKISMFEVTTSWRPYRCGACNAKLWKVEGAP